MYTKRFCELVRNMGIESMTIEQLKHKLQKWADRGHPIKIESFGIFYNGYLTYYYSIDEVANHLMDLSNKDKINYLTILVIEKTFEE